MSPHSEDTNQDQPASETNGDQTDGAAGMIEGHQNIEQDQISAALEGLTINQTTLIEVSFQSGDFPQKFPVFMQQLAAYGSERVGGFLKAGGNNSMRLRLKFAIKNPLLFELMIRFPDTTRTILAGTDVGEFERWLEFATAHNDLVSLILRHYKKAYNFLKDFDAANFQYTRLSSDEHVPQPQEIMREYGEIRTRHLNTAVPQLSNGALEEEQLNYALHHAGDLVQYVLKYPVEAREFLEACEARSGLGLSLIHPAES